MCVVLLGNYLFLAMLFITVHYELFGHVLRCTFTGQEQSQLGVIGYCPM